jgi:hypothetical protein
MGCSRKSIEFTLAGLTVQLSRVGERWMARVGESVAIGSGAQQVLMAALEPVRGASASVLLADLALLGPSLEVIQIERAS